MAVTWHPQARANANAKWPKPPIPMTATRPVGGILDFQSAVKTVKPAHIKGAASLGFKLSGIR